MGLITWILFLRDSEKKVRLKLSRNIWYFAYGSNMDAKRMKKRIGRLSDRILGVVRNWRLEFNKASKNIPGASFANIVPCSGEVVEDILYTVTEEELRKLNFCEVVPVHYQHHRITVGRQDTGEVVAAVTYLANPDKVRDGLKPTRGYIGYLLSEADCLSEEYMQRLRAVKTLG